MNVRSALSISTRVFSNRETCKHPQQHVENSDYTLCTRLTPVHCLRWHRFLKGSKLIRNSFDSWLGTRFAEAVVSPEKGVSDFEGELCLEENLQYCVMNRSLRVQTRLKQPRLSSRAASQPRMA
jgi:hypothetical protein